MQERATCPFQRLSVKVPGGDDIGRQTRVSGLHRRHIVVPVPSSTRVQATHDRIGVEFCQREIENEVAKLHVERLLGEV